MLLRNTSVVVASLLLGSASSLHSQNGAVQAGDRQELRFRGSIDENDVAGLSAILKTQRVSRIYLDSGGGDEIASLKIAKLVAANKIDTQVDGRCLSACFNIFVAGHNKTISDRSIVATHHNAYGVHAWILDAGFRANAISKAEKSSLLSRLGIIYRPYDEAFGGTKIADYLTASFYLMRPDCVSIHGDGAAGRQRIFVKTQRSWVVPGAHVLSQLGVKLPAHWPSAQGDLPAYLASARSHLSRAENAVLLEDLTNPSSYRPAPIGICET